MDMTSFFCWAKVFPWAGSWALFLMTAGCCKEHCWAGWKWNDHQCEHLLFSWHDLQQKAWGCEKNIQSCFQQLQNGGGPVWKAEGQMTQLWAPFGCQYFECHMYDYDLQFPVLYPQPGARISSRVGFWKLMDSVDSSPNQKGARKVSSTEAKTYILMSNWQLMYVFFLRCFCFRFATELSIVCYNIWIEGDDKLNGAWRSCGFLLVSWVRGLYFADLIIKF